MNDVNAIIKQIENGDIIEEYLVIFIIEKLMEILCQESNVLIFGPLY